MSFPFSICTRCRFSLLGRAHPEEWLRSNFFSIRRHRSGTKKSNKSNPKFLPSTTIFSLGPHSTHKKNNKHTQLQPKKENKMPQVRPERVVDFFQDNASIWISKHQIYNRLITFGVSTMDINILFNGFVAEVEAGHLSDPESQDYYMLERFSRPHDNESSLDAIYSTIFFSWAGKPENARKLEELKVQPQTISLLQNLLRLSSRPYPVDEYPRARAMHRKIIMHVGPTNSGKTHHALRALVSAKSGVYAGPLRLLAHEIWHRINKGLIVPLGVEEPPAAGNRNFDGNPEYARLCNMVTGEEQKIMGPDVNLMSCTVEMVSFTLRYNVAVIDEIQMISDPQRGCSWMNAVLGVCADEIHVCGEETAVPIVKALLKDTEDELVVKRYERLSPLVVETSSLNGDFKNVRKGDCIVTFSRSNIFAMKQMVESKTGMRCAVVYGRLPPEVRSEQAALFNDPNSGYDVIIGSDAIGMGLNLKIKRIIFESVKKFEHGAEVQLSVSSVKQIAGRAGRYGLDESGNADAGGTVTTLHAEDLAHVQKCISSQFSPLPFSRVGYSVEFVDPIREILPPNAPLSTIFAVAEYVGRIPPHVRYTNPGADACAFIDSHLPDMTTEDKLTLLNSPIPWRDFAASKVIKECLLQYDLRATVDIYTILEKQKFIRILGETELVMKDGKVWEKPPPNIVSNLFLLETFHKIIVFYIWMTFRNPVAYADFRVQVLKERVEKVLNWSLEVMTSARISRVAKDAENSDGKSHTAQLEYKSRYEMKKIYHDSLVQNGGKEKLYPIGTVHPAHPQAVAS